MTQADTRITVNETSVRTYGTNAQQTFEEIRGQLVQMVDAVATVDYEGANAAKFKKECATLAADFSARLLKDIATIADAVRTSTSNIANSLGGKPIIIQVNSSAVPIPAIKSDPDGTQVANLPHLEALIPDVKSRFTNLATALNGHLADLKRTVWTGQAKNNAVDAVTRFTQQANMHGEEAMTSITQFIQNQITSTRASDQ